MNDLYDMSKYEITPDTYFYDPSTSREGIVRYKKVDDKYYLCDKNGNITNEEEQNITNIKLVEYVGTTAGNISTGTAGFSNSEFILGEGKTAPDSITISESGSTQESDTEYRTLNRSIGVKNFTKMTITISDIGNATITVSADGTKLYNRSWSGGGMSGTYDISKYNTISISHFSLASSSFPSISIKLS